MRNELLEKVAETNANWSSMKSELSEKIAETNTNQSSMKSELLGKISGLQNSIDKAVANIEKTIVEREARLT